mmetsp:Transcript_91937/g.256122  ORF Transcript_91937/g.256122 Transcript_91937/m.256122 type:complete len:1055 (-) Transcript_91937:12-3176(-)
MPGMPGMPGMAPGFMAGMGGMAGMAAMMNMFPDQDGSRTSGAGVLRSRDERDGGGGSAGDDKLNNDVRDFCDKWNLEQRFETRLIEQLRKRGSTWREDLSSLGSTLQDARSPPALLSVKLREMEEGTFQPGRGGGGGDRCRFSHGDAGGGGGGRGGGGGFGKGGGGGRLSDWMMDDIRDFCDKYNLDDRLQRRLTDAMQSRDRTFKDDMRSLGEVLATARNPPGLLSVKLREMEDGTFVAKGGGRGCGDRGDRGDRGGGGGGFGGFGEGMPAGRIMSADRKRELFGSLSPPPKKHSKSRSRSKKRRNRSDSRDRRRRSKSRRRGSRSHSRKRGKDREKDRDRECERDEKDSDRERDREKDRERDKAEKAERPEKDRDREKGEKDRDRERGDKDREREKDRERSRSRDRDRDKGRKEKKEDKERAKDRDKDRERESGTEKERDRDRDKESRGRGGGVEIAPPGAGVQIAPPSSAGVQIAPPGGMDDDEVHYGVTCGRCSVNPIRGDRFKCSICESYDLCETCYERKAEVHPGNHRFFVQKVVQSKPTPQAEDQLPTLPAESSSQLPATTPPLEEPTSASPAAMTIDHFRQLQLLIAKQLAGGQLDPSFASLLQPAQAAALAAASLPAAMPSTPSVPAAVEPSMPAPPAMPVAPVTPAAPAIQTAPAMQTAPAVEAASPILAAPSMPSAPREDELARPSPERPPMEQEPPSAQAAAPQSEPAATVPEAAPAPEPEAPVKKKTKQSEPAWLPPDLACGLCSRTSETGEPHGVICRRRRKNGSIVGCGQGVCWVCMESRPRSELGMVRTTREELESLEEGAWWMHERCMEEADLRAYYGSEKELARARAAAAREEEAEQAKASGSGARGPQAAAVDPVEAVKEQIRKLSVKELKMYLDRHQADRTGCVEKKELLAKALEVASKAPAEPAKGPAWMTVGATCRLCTKPVTKEFAGVVCRRHRADGSIGGCGEGICWRCMKRAPRESFGNVRTTKEEFESLEDDAWWMHEGCFEEGDYKDYFGESEPEEEKRRREQGRHERLEAESRSDIGSIMRRCESR